MNGEREHLVVVSYKECREDPESGTGFSTTGGFPFQVAAISEIFQHTTVILPVYSVIPQNGITPLFGKNLLILPVRPPVGENLRRKLFFPVWLVTEGRKIFQRIQDADAVHTPLPGDIGLIGLFSALIFQKPVFVRHCGTWGNKSTLANRFLTWFLPRIAGGRNVVMATGGGNAPPCPENRNIQWIFSTSLSEKEWKGLAQASPWKQGEELRLVTVGRVTNEKNAAAIIRALPQISNACSEVHLDVVGEGPAMKDLKAMARKTGIAHRVSFHGNVSHDRVLEILSQAHVFVFPTNVKEGFPKAVIEAMACSLPIIAANVSVIPHLIGDQCGVVLEKTDPESVGRAVLDMISDENRLAQMGRNARETSREYTLERWQAIIKERLEAAWGPQKSEVRDQITEGG